MMELFNLVERLNISIKAILIMSEEVRLKMLLTKIQVKSLELSQAQF